MNIKIWVIAIFLIIFSILLIVASVIIFLTIFDNIQARKYNKKKELRILDEEFRLNYVIHDSQDIEELLEAIYAKNIINNVIITKNKFRD